MQSAPKPCTVCSALVRDGTSRCEAHKPAPWVSRAAVKRTTGRKLQAQRAALFTREPLCRQCRKEGRATPATVRDHIRNLADGGTDDDTNIQPLCHDCHDAKTQREAARGRGGQMSGRAEVETGLAPKFLRAHVSGVGGVNLASDEQASALPAGSV